MRVLIRHLPFLLAGLLTVFAYEPFGVPILILPALGLLFYSWRNAHPSAAAWRGFAWGVGAFFAGIGWLIVALSRFGGMPVPIAVLAILLFSGYLALFPALAGAAFAKCATGSFWRDTLLVAAMWALTEWVRGWLFTGFPWLAIGYTQTPPSPLSGFAPVIGVYGIGFLVALLAAALAFGLPRRSHWIGMVACIGVITGIGVLLRQVSWTVPAGAPVSVALVQPDVPQEIKWDKQRALDLLRLNADEVAQTEAQLLAMPESSLPMLTDQLPQGYLHALGERTRRRGGDTILGVFTQDASGRIFNSAMSIGTSASQTYSKNHLVPFGEYSPPLFGWFYQLAHIPMADQTRGGSNQLPLAVAGQKIAVNICYEDLFGEELIRQLPEATLMLNMSNLAWYGDSHAQPQHLQIARMRALETGRPMLRATNTGMTAWIEPDGRVAAILAPFTRGILEIEVRGYAGLTPFARWGNYGFLVIAVLCMVTAVVGRRPREGALFAQR